MKLSTLVLATTLSAVSLLAADNQQIRAMADEARNARKEAQEIGNLLKAKRPDLDAVRQKVQVLATHTSALREHVSAFEASNPSLTPSQAEEWKRISTAAQILHIFVQNKTEMLAEADAQKNRSILRAKADGIAKRADLVERSLARIGS